MAYEGSETAGLIPATVLTGFLGSGKTTLLNRILTSTHGKKIAIVENEYGDVAIDDKLISKNSKHALDGEIVEVLNGCVCCSVRSDLIAFLHKLANRIANKELHLDAIVIETTGMADPSPVAQTFLVDETVRDFFRLDGIVTLIDAKHVERHLDEPKPEGAVNEAAAQAAFADRLLLNKTDLVDTADLERIEARLAAINPHAPIVRCSHSNVSVDHVLGIHGFDLARTLQKAPSFLDASGPPTAHDGTVSSVSLDQGAPRHLRTVGRGALDLTLLRDWLDELLASRGADIFRMKGVLHIAHASGRYVCHAVHEIFSDSFEQEWAEGEARESKLVFIGKNLDAAALAAGFDACLATTDNLAARAARLRFKAGDAIICLVDDHSWATGRVLSTLYREEEMQPGVLAAYELQLDDDPPGDTTYCVPDDPRCILAAPQPHINSLTTRPPGQTTTQPVSQPNGHPTGQLAGQPEDEPSNKFQKLD